jgi:hypothetical protein
VFLLSFSLFVLFVGARANVVVCSGVTWRMGITSGFSDYAFLLKQSHFLLPGGAGLYTKNEPLLSSAVPLVCFNFYSSGELP